MTNRTDLDKCLAQIELVKQLLGPETFDLKKILIELETKKKLLMMFKTRDYARILQGLESGVLKHPGDWVFEEKKVEIPTKKEEKTPEVLIDPKELEIKELKEQLVVLKAVKELEKKDPEIILE